MERFDELDAVHGKSYEMWIDGDKMAEVLAATAKTDMQTETVYISGQMANGTMVTSTDGNGTLKFNTICGDEDTFIKKINDAVKNNKEFVFDLIGNITNKSTGKSRRTIIEDCKITSFSPLDIDITKLLSDSYTYKYNPQKCDIE